MDKDTEVVRIHRRYARCVGCDCFAVTRIIKEPVIACKHALLALYYPLIASIGYGRIRKAHKTKVFLARKREKKKKLSV
jgi:hypothetical protein